MESTFSVFPSTIAVGNDSRAFVPIPSVSPGPSALTFVIMESLRVRVTVTSLIPFAVPVYSPETDFVPEHAARETASIPLRKSFDNLFMIPLLVNDDVNFITSNIIVAYRLYSTNNISFTTDLIPAFPVDCTIFSLLQENPYLVYM